MVINSNTSGFDGRECANRALSFSPEHVYMTSADHETVSQC